MNVAIDIDGTISERPEFFALLSRMLRESGHRIIILTYRDPLKAEFTRAQLDRWQIEFDDLVIAPSLDGKGGLCESLEIDLFFDDQDECIASVPERTLVFKVRNGGNFDFQSNRWVSTSRLTRLI